MKVFSKLLFLLIFCTAHSVQAQQLKQTIRGTVVDHITKAPLPGATVVVLGSDPLIGTTTDKSGDFRLVDLPVGSYTLKVSFIGFKDVLLPNVKLNSGKEVVLTLFVEEDITQIDEFIVTADEKDRTINDMIQVSGRTFSVEETRKFAAAVNDPGRMAISFPGVTGTDDGNNNISIRGNSPNGLLWRMEGIDIPNPNHFVNPGTAGGGISILSSQLLSDSDFITAAFPTEYGNALSGVFDLNLRKGNNENQEFTFQAGFLGVDLAAEGPIAKGYRGSYLVNYRYSTLSLLSKLGLPLGDFVTNFQDLSFNVFLPTGPKSTVTIFGFGGLSDQDGNAQKDSLKWESDWDRYSSRFFSNTGAVGLKHSYILNQSNFLQSTILASGNSLGSTSARLDDNLNFQGRSNENYSNSKITLSSVLNTKISAKAALRSGFYLNQLYYNLREDAFEEEIQSMQTHINSKGNTQSVQAFSQLNYRANERLTFNLGLHYLQLLLNNSKSLEPRFSASYALDEKQRLSLGYGLHGQVQPLGTYFAEQEVNGQIILPNENLDLSKSHHFVLGYDRTLNSYLRMKVETYYQHLFQIPIRSGADETYSIINQQWTFTTDPLVNEGFGRNYGVELTLEQFTYKGFYFLLSSSIYNSLYKTNEDVWRNTAYNGNYNVTLTAGKEYELKKNRVFGVNLRSIYSGGLRDTPIDLDASIEKGEGVYIEDQLFSEKNPSYFRADLRFSLTKNKPKSTRIWSLDIQNATNRKNVFGEYFEPLSNEIKTSYQAPLIPILSYRVEF
ncbi:TonB-dependent receptor [Algoriphagus sp. AGSA1]|uniref:TonB-dependent receptor n=1 Tax=Algoriphagus sp. AGSA1 TaxID=2907213 RepID=UPI001F1E4634|nr:TonB-dependent receptor [Algoriphagus sp. AGSA1]MCE7056953.1 TonB-dependent receptor [Algoriphagus sp. AGSA1]